MAELRETDRRRQAQMVETLQVIRDMRREMVDMQAELLALREQQRRARQPGPVARVPDYQEASRDADRTEGVVGLTKWIEKMESVFNIIGCAIENQVKFATCTLLGAALTWWNGQIRTLGPDAYSMTWEVLKKKMTDKYCPQGEIKKLEIELWNLKVKGNDVPTYTERFQELTLICTKFVANETEKVDKYISGLPDNIYGNVKSARPKTLDETIELANDLMDQKLRTFAEWQSDNKRKADDSSINNHGHQQQPFKRQNITKVYNMGTRLDHEVLPPLCRYAHSRRHVRDAAKGLHSHTSGSLRVATKVSQICWGNLPTLCVIRLDFHTSFDFLGYGVETYVNVRIVNTGIGVMCTRARDSDYTENYLSYKVGVQQEIGYGVSMGGDMGWTVTRVSETPYSHRTTDTTYQQYLRRLGMEDHTSTYIHCEYRHSDNLCSHLMIKEADGQQNSLDVCWNADSRDKHRTVYTDILRVGGQWNYTLARDLGYVGVCGGGGGLGESGGGEGGGGDDGGGGGARIVCDGRFCGGGALQKSPRR
ncbi:putative reverse transcriptase domain-containing protein, partial [Tanacetum coccineum]